jgi:hypothetical protein
MSVPGLRDAPRRETNPRFRHLKSLRRESIKLWSMCQLFSSHFSLGNQSASRNYRGVGHAVNRFISAIDCRFSCSPLLSYDYRSLFEVQSTRGKVLLRKNMALSFEDTLPSGTCITGVSPGKGGSLDSNVMF